VRIDLVTTCVPVVFATLNNDQHNMKSRLHSLEFKLICRSNQIALCDALPVRTTAAWSAA
jgi:hypothetical protein